MPAPESKESAVFKMPQRLLISYLFKRHGIGWLVGLSIGVISLIIFAIITADVRFGILALMMIFIVIPMALAFIYLTYALKSSIAFNILPHSISLTEEGLNVKIYKNLENSDLLDNNGKQKKKKKKKKSLWDEEDEEKEMKIEKEQKVEKEEANRSQNETDITFQFIPLSQIGRYEVGLDSVIINLLHPSENLPATSITDKPRNSHINSSGLLYIPVSAFSSMKEYSAFLKDIYENNKKII